MQAIYCRRNLTNNKSYDRIISNFEGGKYIMTFEEKRKQILEYQKELAEKLNKYNSYLDKKTYDYYYNLLYFQTNAWTQEDQEIYKLFEPLFGDIINFNLKYYMIEALKRDYGGSNVWYDFDARKISVGNLEAKISSSNANSDEAWLLKIKMPHAYDEKFSTKRLEFMKRIREELSHNGHSVNGHSVGWMFSDLINEMENGDSPFPFKKICENQEEYRAVLNFLMEKYQFKIPEEYNTSEFDIDMSEMSVSELKKLEDKYDYYAVFYETIVQETAKRKILLTTPLIHSYKGKKIVG